MLHQKLVKVHNNISITRVQLVYVYIHVHQVTHVCLRGVGDKRESSKRRVNKRRKIEKIILFKNYCCFAILKYRPT